ncbi:hypothetical protein SAMN04488078_102420 [Antarctobacter heliothermus]|uniref:Uncharacterized protein n=2 Tax=Antarctobacter heliothermus TaxID=74033 RepID=A0A239G3N4_9RHOB|nr:hypothetical protein SAMN04488078_102420 [Antarctobacter heliothermus]
MIRKFLSFAVLAASVGAMPSPSAAQTCVEAGCSDYCGPGFIQIVGECLHVTDKGDRCVNESFRTPLSGAPRPVGTLCTAKNDEGESYSGWVGPGY